jgi:hypothetical protein
MSVEQMAARCPDAQPVAKALLYGMKFAINSEGVATIVPDGQSVVIGLVWGLSARDEMILDIYEGVSADYYTKHRLPIEQLDGTRLEALTYIAADDVPGVPREGYMELIVEASKQLKFPREYVSMLRSFLSNEENV